MRKGILCFLVIEVSAPKEKKKSRGGAERMKGEVREWGKGKELGREERREKCR